MIFGDDGWSSFVNVLGSIAQSDEGVFHRADSYFTSKIFGHVGRRYSDHAP